MWFDPYSVSRGELTDFIRLIFTLSNQEVPNPNLQTPNKSQSPSSEIPNPKFQISGKLQLSKFKTYEPRSFCFISARAWSPAGEVA
jgi:hypothetical protein